MTKSVEGSSDTLTEEDPMVNIRHEHDVTRQDSDGRYYKLVPDGDRNIRAYGYYSHFGHGYICFTDGFLCECGDRT